MVIRLSPALQLWLLHVRRPQSQTLSEEVRETEAACSFILQLLELTFKRRGGGCYDNTPADREDVGSGRETYITIIIFWGGGGGG